MRQRIFFLSVSRYLIFYLFQVHVFDRYMFSPILCDCNTDLLVHVVSNYDSTLKFYLFLFQLKFYHFLLPLLFFTCSYGSVNNKHQIIKLSIITLFVMYFCIITNLAITEGQCISLYSNRRFDWSGQ
jgi:hypothetical protein